MAKCISDKELASKIYKELLKPSNKWANKPFKMDKWPENYLNEENKSIKNKHIKKNAPHQSLLGKCKLK